MLSTGGKTRCSASVNIGMARTADHQGFTLAGCHHLDPGRFICLSWSVEVLEGSNVVDLNILLAPTQLAGLRQKPLFEL